MEQLLIARAMSSTMVFISVMATALGDGRCTNIVGTTVPETAACDMLASRLRK